METAAIDASEVTYTPAVLTDWDGDADPGDVDDALDQLAERVDDNEIAIAGFTGTHDLLFSQVVDVTVANTTTETALTGAGRGSKTVTANTLDIGTVIRLTLGGYLSNTSTPTLNVKVTLGGSEVCSTGAFTTASGLSSDGWRLEVEIVCRATGASGAVISSGTFNYGDGNTHDLIKAGATVVDTTGTLALSVTVTWGTANASNTITSQIATFEILKANNLAVAAPSGLSATEV
jgi:hypothetical protein